MARFRITYAADLLGPGPTAVTAEYYSLEDGWLHFKDEKGKHLATIAAGTIWSIERETN